MSVFYDSNIQLNEFDAKRPRVVVKVPFMPVIKNLADFSLFSISIIILLTLVTKSMAIPTSINNIFCVSVVSQEDYDARNSSTLGLSTSNSSSTSLSQEQHAQLVSLLQQVN